MQWLARLFLKNKMCEADGTDTPPRDNGAEEKERERQAYYMKNFWSYDGAEQEDWEGA